MKKVLFYIGGVIVMISLFGSCVSKKKYEDLARAKKAVDRELLAEQQAKAKLESELKLAKEDFNTIRYKLTENNAETDKTIDQLFDYWINFILD